MVYARRNILIKFNLKGFQLLLPYLPQNLFAILFIEGRNLCEKKCERWTCFFSIYKKITDEARLNVN